MSVAEGAKDRGDDRTEGAWRREGPLPPLDDRRRPSSGGGFGSRDREPGADIDRGERMGFGSKFTPSADEGPRGYRRAPGSERAPSYGGFSGSNAEEETGARWGLGSKFTPSPADERRGGGGFGSGGGSDREPPQRGSAFVPSPTTEGPRPGFGDRKVSEAPPSQADSASTWRSARPPPSRNGSASREWN